MNVLFIIYMSLGFAVGVDAMFSNYATDLTGVSYEDGGKYEGAVVWDDDAKGTEAARRHGQGKMTYADGGVYIGDWRYDQRYGEGTMKYTGGNVYHGNWVSDKRHGEGTMIYEGQVDGKEGGEYVNVYHGNWFSDKRHGKGTMTYEGQVDGKKGGEYVGDWENGVRHGEGTMTYKDKDGTTYTGHWENDKPSDKKYEKHLKNVFYDRIRNKYNLPHINNN